MRIYNYTMLGTVKCQSKHCSKSYAAQEGINFKGVNVCSNVCSHILQIEQYIAVAQTKGLNTDELIEEVQSHFYSLHQEISNQKIKKGEVLINEAESIQPIPHALIEKNEPKCEVDTKKQEPIDFLIPMRTENVWSVTGKHVYVNAGNR